MKSEVLIVTLTKFRLGIAALITVALVAGIMTWTLVGRRTYHFEAEGVPPVTVMVPAMAGKPTFMAMPAAAPESVPLATVLLSRPVRIEAPIVAGTATVTFSYDPAMVPIGVDAGTDLMVVTYLEEYDLWLPVGADVDPIAHTVTAETTHFSQWALAVTDPQQLRNTQALAQRLQDSTGGAIAEWMVGEQDTLKCDPNRVLLAAQVREPVALTTQLCQEVLDDETYRMQYVNTSGMPRVMQLPPGFVEDNESLVDYNESITRLMAARHPGRAVVPDGGSLTVRFADRDIAPDTQITGDTDWAGYFVSLFRLLAATVLLDKAKDGTKERKLAEDIDLAFSTTEIWDCADKAQNELRNSGDLVKAVQAALGGCLKEAIEGIVKVLGGKLGTTKRLLVGFLERRINPLLAIPKLMDLARAEMNGILQAIGTLGFELDTTVTIRPARTILSAEAHDLPHTLGDSDAESLGCGRAPAGKAVPGAPQDACVAAVDADLDGNGIEDILVLWHSPLTSEPDTRWSATRVGAIALLDDGSSHQLEDLPATWKWPSGENFAINLFDATQIVRLGTNTRQQVVVAIEQSDYSTTHIILAVGTDRRLHTVSGSPDGEPFLMFRGGEGGEGSDFGCVTSGGRPLLSITTISGGFEQNPEFYEFLDTRVRYVGHNGGERLVPC